MKQRRRPGSRVFAIAATLALAVGACGGNNTGGSAAPSTGASSAPAESQGGTESTGPAESAPAESGAPSESQGSGTGEFVFEQLGGTVTVVGSWTGSEQESFMAMVQPWMDGTGTEIQYRGSRDLAAELTAGIASGSLPDVAGLPGPGLMKEWYDAGALQPLDFVDFATYEANTPPGFAAAGKSPADDKLIGIFTKAAVKGLIWYNPANWTETEFDSFDALLQAARDKASGDTKPWCLAVESGAASGWAGTDWIEDIVLRQSGPEVYDAWVAGTQKWTSPEIKQAFETFGQAVQDAYGGSDFILTTNFGSGGNGLFTDPPQCFLHHQASFITDFFKSEGGASDDDFDFFVMPDINPSFAGSITTAGDLFGMFNDTPQARSLIQWLLTAEAQQIWVERGGFISMNKGVPADAYPDEASRRSAEMLAAAQNAKFDASDLMPNAMNDGFFKAIVDYIRDPAQLDAILQRLDGIQADAYQQ